MLKTEPLPQTARQWTKLIHSLLSIGAILWIAVLGISLAWNLLQSQNTVLEDARLIAQTAFEKDILYRGWNSGHGGVYVPVTSTTEPNPYLKDIPNQNIPNPAGGLLTLINPAFMSRQAFALQESYTGIKAHITSLKPIRPENAADAWETQALQRFEQGEKEYSSIEWINGKRYLRFMRPLKVDSGCMRCHAQQGYQVGDIRGGISESVPIAPLEENAQSSVQSLWFAHILLGAAGFMGLGLTMRLVTTSIKKQAQAEQELLFASTHDALTGLFNRTYFEGVLESLKIGANPFTILVADVDNLKQTNDQHGHHSGDEVLRAAAQVLKSSLRGEDVLARTGGDEFVAILPGVDDAMAKRILERVQSNLTEFENTVPPHNLSISIGMATARPDQSVSETLRLADQAMYSEKYERKRRTPSL